MKFFNCCKRQEPELPSNQTPLELYTTAFAQYATNNRELPTTIKAIKDIIWNNAAHIAMKDIIITTIKNYFTQYTNFLLAYNDGQPTKNLFTLFQTIINSLPKEWLTSEGIFANLFEAEAPAMNYTIPEPKFMALVTWGMPLVNIPDVNLENIISDMGADGLSALISITSERLADANYLKDVILENTLLKKSLNHYASAFFNAETKELLNRLGYNLVQSSMATTTAFLTHNIRRTTFAPQLATIPEQSSESDIASSSSYTRITEI